MSLKSDLERLRRLADARRVRMPTGRPLEDWTDEQLAAALGYYNGDEPSDEELMRIAGTHLELVQPGSTPKKERTET